MDNNLNELIELANNGDQEAIKKLIQYFKEQGDEENVEYFNDLLLNEENKDKDVNKNVGDYQDVLLDNSLSKNGESSGATYFKMAEECFADGKIDEAMTYYKKAIASFESNENKNDKEKNKLCLSYTQLAECLKKRDLQNDEFLLYLQNATEINCDEKLKLKAYGLLYSYYSTKSEDVANEYFKKMCSLQTFGSIAMAEKIFKGKFEDENGYNYWLDKAKENILNEYEVSQKEYIENFINMISALLENKLTNTIVIQGTRYLYKNNDLAMLIDANDQKKVVACLYNEISNNNLEINNYNDTLLFCSLGVCTYFRLDNYEKEILKFVQEYLLISKNRTDNCTELKETKRTCTDFYEVLAHSNYKKAFKWFEEFVNGNTIMGLETEFDNAKIEYQKRLEEERQQELEHERKEKERKIALAKQRKKILTNARLDCEDIESKITRIKIQEEKEKEEKGKKEAKRDKIEEEKTKYNGFCLKTLIAFVLFFSLSRSKFIPNFWNAICNIILIVWLLRTFIGKNGYRPYFAQKIIGRIKENEFASTAFKSFEKESATNNTYDIETDKFDVDVDTELSFDDIENDCPVYFGKYEKYGYLEKENYTVPEFIDEVLEDVEYHFLNVNINDYETTFKAAYYNDMLFINVPDEEFIEFADAIVSDRTPKNDDSILEMKEVNLIV